MALPVPAPQTAAPERDPTQDAALARAVYEAHRKGLQARRERDLVAEKILLHIDGSGDNQWADILHGQRVAIPLDVHPYPVTEPILRPIVANQVAYHTTMPFRFVAESKQDSEARQRAKIDGAFANYCAQTQRLNQVFAAAMFLADACGFCPVHAMWRDDVEYDPYEPLYLQPQDVEGLAMPRKGKIDAFCGNPFDHVLNPGAKRGSIHWQSYGRVVPGAMIRDRMGVDVKGSTKLPSASIFQRIARQWRDITGLNVHGTPTLASTDGQEEDLLAIICRETAKGVDPEWPEGRLTIIALPGAAETREAGRTGAQPVLLYDDALPAGRFSSVIVYSDQRTDDPHGAPWAEPLSELQVRLNLCLSDRRELIVKAKNAPIITSGPIAEDSRRFDGWTVLEAEGGMGSVSARVMEYSAVAITALKEEAEEIRAAMYTIGGYQAASRGESDAGDPYAKVALLQQQDDTIHGPTNLAFRETVGDFLQLEWCLFKQYGDVGWILDVAGDEFEELPDDYIDNTKLSETPPTFRLTSGYGATPEVKGRQLMQLMQLKGADGVPFLTTAEARKGWPDGSVFDDRSDPSAVKRRRARHIANQIRRGAKLLRQQSGLEETEIAHPWVQQAGQMVFQAAEQRFPRLRDDDLQANLDALSEITQDETEDAIARVAAALRQEQFYAWQQQMAMMGAAPMMLGPGAPQGGGGGGGPMEDPASLAGQQPGAAAFAADPSTQQQPMSAA